MFEYQKVLNQIIEACELEETLISYEEEPESNRFHVRDDVNFNVVRTFEVTPEYVRAYNKDGTFDVTMNTQDELMGFICYGIFDIDPTFGDDR